MGENDTQYCVIHLRRIHQDNIFIKDRLCNKCLKDDETVTQYDVHFMFSESQISQAPFNFF